MERKIGKKIVVILKDLGFEEVATNHCFCFMYKKALKFRAFCY